jgi:hypothetical protein
LASFLRVFPTLALLPRLDADKKLGEGEARHLGGVPIRSVFPDAEWEASTIPSVPCLVWILLEIVLFLLFSKEKDMLHVILLQARGENVFRAPAG